MFCSQERWLKKNKPAASWFVWIFKKVSPLFHATEY
jgi:hypothetical protein